MGIQLPWEGLLTTIADRAGSIIDQLVRDKDLAEKLKAELSAQSMSQNHEIRVAQIEHDKDVELAVQATAQAEQQQDDPYVKRTRPKLARKSFNLAAAYTIWAIVDGFIVHMFLWWGVDRWDLTPEQVTQLSEQVQSLQVDFMPAVFIGLATPVLAYMGVRGIEKTMGAFKTPKGS